MRAWWGCGFGAALIAAAYVADVLLGDAYEAGRTDFTTHSVMPFDAFTRFALVAATIALAWLVFSGPRSRAVGLAMLVVGFCFGLLPQPWLAFEGDLGIQMPSFMAQVLKGPTAYVLWTATAVMTLGIVELVWPKAGMLSDRP